MGLLIQKGSLTASDTCQPTKSTILYYSVDRLYYAKFPSLKYAHISLWLKILRDIPNSIAPQTTLRLLPIPIPVRLLILPCTHQCRRSPPYSLTPPFFFLSQTEEPAKASTCAHDRRELQQLALNVHVTHSDLTWPDLTWPASDTDKQYNCCVWRTELN